MAKNLLNIDSLVDPPATQARFSSDAPGLFSQNRWKTRYCVGCVDEFGCGGSVDGSGQPWAGGSLGVQTCMGAGMSGGAGPLLKEAGTAAGAAMAGATELLLGMLEAAALLGVLL